jgi:hypothetical protein
MIIDNIHRGGINFKSDKNIDTTKMKIENTKMEIIIRFYVYMYVMFLKNISKQVNLSKFVSKIK